jgi:hypothetical protein
MDAIRSTAERIVNAPCLDDESIEGLAKLQVPLSLLLDKMAQCDVKSQAKGSPIGSVRYFTKPLQEFADWYARRPEAVPTHQGRSNTDPVLIAVLQESAEHRAEILADDPDREHAIWCAAYHQTHTVRSNQ